MTDALLIIKRDMLANRTNIRLAAHELAHSTSYATVIDSDAGRSRRPIGRPWAKWHRAQQQPVGVLDSGVGNPVLRVDGRQYVCCLVSNTEPGPARLGLFGIGVCRNETRDGARWRQSGVMYVGPGG